MPLCFLPLYSCCFLWAQQPVRCAWHRSCSEKEAKSLDGSVAVSTILCAGSPLRLHNTAGFDKKSCLILRKGLIEGKAQAAVVLAPGTGSPKGAVCRSCAGHATARAGAAAAAGQDRGEQQDVHGVQVSRLAQVRLSLCCMQQCCSFLLPGKGVVRQHTRSHV